ncbi:hypothetical protein OG455_37755 [Kitasatospora sp. NBC_01287]|uniref:hypothetical protein n=1 Tax=Kitasatospora sp. NBC_01287 TaxID=2903573 RepID=UPI00224DE41E|nr:hypothetical protein [Kitasatospora sp. NBC_01287]MCX4751187.1 hypothetical protein [Kitasatospora sp. NBC_01287]
MSDIVEVSRSESLERLRAQLQGRPFGSARAQARPAPPRAANLLYGVMLRGAARLDAGLPLTDLEERMLAFLRVVLSEDEVREFGRVWREPESVEHASALFPDTLTTRGIDQGYALADLAKDLPGLRADMPDQPNVNVVDLASFDREAEVSSREFAAAAAAYGYGLTLVTDSTAAARERAAAPQPENVLVELKSFRCNQLSDEWSASDEIYWSTAAAADLGNKRHDITRVYENVKRDQTVTMDAGTVLFNGMVDRFLSVDITCWEQDHSPDAWYEKMKEVLQDISGFLQYLSQTMKDVAGYLPLPDYHDMMDYLEIANMIILAFAGLIKLFTNHDDKVCEHTMVFDRPALGTWANDRDPIWRFSFDGGKEGYYTLNAQCVSAINSRPRVMSAPVGTGAPLWGPPATLPSGSLSGGPALAAGPGDMLHCMVNGFGGSGSLWYARLTGAT